MSASTIYGMTLSSKLYKRFETLVIMEKVIEEIKNIIIYSCEESSVILKRMKDKYPRIFSGNLNQSDSLIIDELVNGIGKTDKAGQCDFCDGLLKSVERNLKDAEKDKQERAKLYTVLGISFGVALSILII